MKNKLLLAIISLALLLCACGPKEDPTIVAPFTSATWESQLSHISELEGTEYEESLSMAGGHNYIFPKQYLGYDGFIQYNIDDSNKLAGVSWFYIGNDSDLANEIYKAIEKQTIADLGKEKPLDESNIHTGKQWETDYRKVMLISLAQEGDYAVQITYLPKDK